jgi:hypothetical protein
MFHILMNPHNLLHISEVVTLLCAYFAWWYCITILAPFINIRLPWSREETVKEFSRYSRIFRKRDDRSVGLAIDCDRDKILSCQCPYRHFSPSSLLRVVPCHVNVTSSRFLMPRSRMTELRTPSLPIVFMAWCLMKHINTFFLLPL